MTRIKNLIAEFLGFNLFMALFLLGLFQERPLKPEEIPMAIAVIVSVSTIGMLSWRIAYYFLRMKTVEQGTNVAGALKMIEQQEGENIEAIRKKAGENLWRFIVITPIILILLEVFFRA